MAASISLWPGSAANPWNFQVTNCSDLYYFCPSASTWSPPAPCWCPDYCRWPTCSRCWTPGSHSACAIFLCSLDENLVGQLTGEHLADIQLVHIHRTRSLLHSVHWLLPSGRAFVDIDRWCWVLRTSILFAIEYPCLAFTGVLFRLDISSLRAELD